MSYYYLAIMEIVHAKSLKGYGNAIRYMLNHELEKEPVQVGQSKVIHMVKQLSQEHKSLKEWEPQRNKETNKRIAEEAYSKIYNEFIGNKSDDNIGIQ